MEVADRRLGIITDFLASAHIFTAAMNELMEKRLLSSLGAGLTGPQVKLLKLVEKTAPESIRDVAAFLRVSNAAASKAVDRLVRRGLIARSESTDDRRAMHISLTPEGKAILDRLQEAQYEALEGLFRQFMPDDFHQARELLDQLSVDLVRDVGEGDDLCFRCGIYFRDTCLLRDVSNRTCYIHVYQGRKARGDRSEVAEGRPGGASHDAGDQDRR